MYVLNVKTTQVAKLEVHEAASQLRIIELIDENKALVQVG